MKENNENVLKEFYILGPASILYSLIFVFCIYKNFSGITSPIWALTTIGYMVFMSQKFQKKWNGINTFLSAAIVMLGISNFITTNITIIFFNYIAIVLLIIMNMMYLFINTKNINITRHLALLLKLSVGTLEKMDAPWKQMSLFIKSKKEKKSRNALYAFIGLLIAVPLLILLTVLLASADGVFRETFIALIEMLSLDTLFKNILGLIVMLIAGYMLPYSFTKYISGNNISIKEGNIAENEPIIAIIVTGSISLVYSLFSAIQIIYLFMGKGQLPAGYSYAEYAREGFFQLLLVCILNVIIVLICLEFFREHKVLKIVLSIMSVCTFVMIASSAFRMGMYIREFGLTFMRILVLWTLCVITFIMIGFLYKIFNMRFHIFKYSVIVVTICFTILSLSHVDYFIAKYDLNKYEEMKSHYFIDDYSEYVDFDYLMELSTDAAPAIMEHKEEIYPYMQENGLDISEVNWSYKNYAEYDKNFNIVTIRKFNLSKHISKLSMEEMR